MEAIVILFSPDGGKQTEYIASPGMDEDTPARKRMVLEYVRQTWKHAISANVLAWREKPEDSDAQRNLLLPVLRS